MPAGRPPDLKRRRLIATMRAHGLSASAIGRALGVTYQAIQCTLRSIDNPKPPRTAACEGCGRAIAFEGLLPRDQEGALCLPCLAERPKVPFGQRLKAFRLAAGMTKEELARRSGLDRNTIHDYETGQTEPIWPRLTRLIKVLGVGLVALGFERFSMPAPPELLAAKNRHRPRKPR
jgi:transcriptional regulator with XRE-family HTH domain